MEPSPTKRSNASDSGHTTSTSSKRRRHRTSATHRQQVQEAARLRIAHQRIHTIPNIMLEVSRVLVECQNQRHGQPPDSEEREAMTDDLESGSEILLRLALMLQQDWEIILTRDPFFNPGRRINDPQQRGGV